MKFKDFPVEEKIKSNIERMGWNRPTDIQYKVIFPVLKGEDVLAIAQTGTGKTASFVIPTVHFVAQAGGGKKYQKRTPEILVMVPTRELSEQIRDVYVELAKGLDVKIMTLMGGVEQDAQIEQLKKGVDIVIATPGRMFDLVSQGYLKLENIKTVVLDEADHMLDLGFIKDIRDLNKKLPRNRQTLFFSATIDKDIKKIAYELVKNAIRIQISPKNPVAKNIEHSVTFVAMDDKRFFLENLVKENDDKKMIAFVRTKVRAERVVKAMERVGVKAEALHGGIPQDERFSIFERFKSGENQLLITTDVAARGIDIPGVHAVVNYDLPEVPENYVHRVGRTGRGKEKGWAIAFCSEEEKPFLQAIEEYTGDAIPVYELSKGDYLAVIEDSEDITYNWQSLIEEDNKRNQKKGW
ncbi:MAG: DEAD/DEAH box helicase [Crocinitomicaceae bacterium]|nr:DEAD/DEAH box helicase [Crocinitomicaceae bacterium]